MRRPHTPALELELAMLFAGVLRGWLSDAEWADMRRKNAERPATQTWCASHDYCDANTAMAEAFVLAGLDLPDVSSDEETDLWNAAWAVADRRYLGGKS